MASEDTFDVLYVTTNGGKKVIVCSSYWHDGEVTAYPRNYVGDRFTEALANHEQPKSDWIRLPCELLRSYENINEALERVESGRGARIQISKNIWTPKGNGNVRKVNSNAKLQPVSSNAVEKAKPPPTSLSQRKPLGDVTNQRHHRGIISGEQPEVNQSTPPPKATEVESLSEDDGISEHERSKDAGKETLNDTLINDLDNDDGVVDSPISGGGSIVEDENISGYSCRENGSVSDETSNKTGKRRSCNGVEADCPLPVKKHQTHREKNVTRVHGSSKLSKLLERVLYEQQKTNAKIEQLRRNQHQPSAKPPPKMDNLPVKNIQELNDFESSLSALENADKLVAFIESLSSSNKKASVISAWKKVASDNVLRKCNWTGKPYTRNGYGGSTSEERFRLQDTKLVKYMIDGIRRSSAELSTLKDEEFKSITSDYTRHAPQRWKNEAGRRAASQSDVQ